MQASRKLAGLELAELAARGAVEFLGISPSIAATGRERSVGIRVGELIDSEACSRDGGHALALDLRGRGGV